MDTELSHRRRLALTVCMVVADPTVVFFVYYLLFATGLLLRDWGIPPTVPFFFGFAYYLAYASAVVGGVLRDDYPWFVASWTVGRKATGRIFDKNYSFHKFRHSLIRAVKRSTLWRDRALFVRAFAFDLTPELLDAKNDTGGEGRAHGSGQLPGLRELIRALNLRFNKIVCLIQEDERARAVDAEIATLREMLNGPRQPLDGYLRYLVRAYKEIDPKVREIVHEPTRFGLAIDRIPRYQPTLALIVTLLLALLAWLLVGAPMPFYP